MKAAVEELITHLKRREYDVRENEQSQEVASFSVSTPSRKARRPSVAAFSVRNETGLQLTMWLPHDSTELLLEGNGGEVEVDAPAEEALWTAVESPDVSVSDLNGSRRLSLSCFLSLTGYESMSLSAEQTGIELITFTPDSRNVYSSILSNGNTSAPLSVVWDVSMRDGVPFCCIRSLLRILNRTQVPLEVNVSSLMVPELHSFHIAHNLITDSSSAQAYSNHGVHHVVDAGGTWSIPVDSIDHNVRLRPALFDFGSPLEQRNPNTPDSMDSTDVQSHNYDWSDS